jgi:hypothetical protein
MALETRQNQKQMLFNLMKARHRDSELEKSKEFKEVILSLTAVMEEEDVALVEKKIKELDK